MELSNEELQQRAFEIAMRHPGVRAGDIESCREDLWLLLYEELGWKEAALIDFDLLMTQLDRTVEADRLRAEGWSAVEVKEFQVARDFMNLIEESRPVPGQTADWRRLAGALDDAIYAFLHGPSTDHRYLKPVPGTAGPEQIEAMLVTLGAPSTCMVGRLDTLSLPLKGKAAPLLPELPDQFDAGSRLPLRKALEIADESGWEAVLFCVPRRLAYVQHHEIATARNQCRAIAYRPTGTSTP